MISYKSVVLDASKDQFNNLMVRSNPERTVQDLRYILLSTVLFWRNKIIAKQSPNPGGGDTLADIIWNKQREDHQK